MSLSQESLERFKAIYRAEFGVDLSDEEATEKAERLLGLIRLLRRPLPRYPHLDDSPRPSTIKDDPVTL